MKTHCEARIFRKPFCLYLAVIFFSLATASSHLYALEPLNIALNPVDGVQRTAVYKQIRAFEKLNPNIRVNVRVSEHETYKATIENLLSAKSDKIDLFFWFGGEKLRHFADNGWLLPISSVWRANQWQESFSSSAIDSVTRKNEQYGVPLYYYQWGIYYRKSIFNKLNLEVPKNWDSFLEAAAKIKQAGYIPFTLGSKNNWPVAGWFDYLNLRLNGLSFHQELLLGCHAFTDPKVEKVFEYFAQLAGADYFHPNHNKMNWNDALPYLYHGKAAMMLMGNFFTANIPEKLRDDIEFFPFPIIDKNIPVFEDAPIDVIALSAFAKNRSPAIELIEFFASAEAQSQLAADMNMIPPRTDTLMSEDKYIQAGDKLLKKAKGLAQFYDRDTKPAFSELSMPILVDFISNPTDINNTLLAMEKARKTALGNAKCR